VEGEKQEKVSIHHVFKLLFVPRHLDDEQCEPIRLPDVSILSRFVSISVNDFWDMTNRLV
jgi:hypothetical protein